MSTKHFSNNSVLRRASQFEHQLLGQQQQAANGFASQKSPSATTTTTETISSSTPRSSLEKSKSAMKPTKTIKTPLDDKDSSGDDCRQDRQFLSAACSRFKREFVDIHPDANAPFDEISSFDDAREKLNVTQRRIGELRKELAEAEFAATFLQKVLLNEKKDFDKNVNTTKIGAISAATIVTKDFENHHSDDSLNDDENGSSASASTKEQYVTVITLNDSTYGEIQRHQKVSPSSNSFLSSSTSSSTSVFTTTTINDNNKKEQSKSKLKTDSDSNHNYDNIENMEKIIPKANSASATLEVSKDLKNEPIYSNTLETQKTSDKVAKKRPPTPPRKPKFNKLQGSSGDIFGSVSAMSNVKSSISKSESLKSISRIQRKFNGPLQQIEKELSTPKTSNANRKDEDAKKGNGNKMVYMRTFSHEPKKTDSEESEAKTTEPSQEADEITILKQNIDEPCDELNDHIMDDDSLYRDDCDIYDTVAPDYEGDSNEQPLNEDTEDDREEDEGEEEEEEEEEEKTCSSTRDDETSSHEMLSRSSSTDELSNYVNIDYFLRKSSLGRSNSNIKSRLNRGGEKIARPTGNHESEEDNETNMSSMRSSDYEHFSSSNENLIDPIPPQLITSSLRSFASSVSGASSAASANSSTGGSLRTRSLKTHSNNIASDLSTSYPPNLSTFTPPIRDRNQTTFFPSTVAGIASDGCSSQYVSPFSREENLIHSHGSELNLSNSSKNSSSPPHDKSSSSSVEYYAYTDIIDSLPNNESTKPSVESFADESVSLMGTNSNKSQNLYKSDDSLNEKSCEEQALADKNRHMQWSIIRSIIEGETVYLDCLSTLIQYKKAMSTTTQLLNTEDLNTIFHCIPELHQLHNSFLNGLKNVEHGYKMKHSSMTSDSRVATKLIMKQSVGELFHRLAANLGIYSEFLRNYSMALETASRCSANNPRFSEIIKSIKVASTSGQFSNLVDLLHVPVARLQKNALVLHDLLKYVDLRHEEERTLLQDALKMTQAFLNELNLDATRKIFPMQDKFQRRLVKESFIIESGGENRRKLRHLFLFNDVIVCAKYKPSTKQKYTFELKWFQMLNDILLDPALDLYCTSIASSASPSTLSRSSTFNTPNTHKQQQYHNQHSVAANAVPTASQRDNSAKENKDIFASLLHVESLKARAFACRYDMFIEEKKSKGKFKVSDKYRKKISELESELVLWLPPLKFAFNVKSSSHKCHTFYLSSEYERSCWFEAIKRMQQSALLNSSNNEQASLIELQRWIESCRKSIHPNLGSFLLRTTKDGSLRFGDLYLRFVQIKGFNQKKNIFFVIETDSYGHYFKHALTGLLSPHETANINQEFLIELEGTQSLRILCYEFLVNKRRSPSNDRKINDTLSGTTKDHCEVNERNSIFQGKVSLDLISSCLQQEFKTKELLILDSTLTIEMSFVSWKSMMERIPPSKICGIFGLTVAQVCKKEKSKVPYLIMSCINEVQRRGLHEVGIYRVSGLASDVQRLRKAFETSPRDACWLIGHIDIHAVTGLLKLYLRELPGSLFTDEMYKKYVEARDVKQFEEKERRMTALMAQLIEPNQSTVLQLIEHLVRVNRYEESNKMSLNNLATIFGPTMLRTKSSSPSSGGINSKSSNSISGGGNTPSASGGTSNASNFSSFAINTDLFTASTIDVMAQADILYFFLRRKAEGLSLTSTEREETSL